MYCGINFASTLCWISHAGIVTGFTKRKIQAWKNETCRKICLTVGGFDGGTKRTRNLGIKKVGWYNGSKKARERRTLTSDIYAPSCRPRSIVMRNHRITHKSSVIASNARDRHWPAACRGCCGLPEHSLITMLRGDRRPPDDRRIHYGVHRCLRRGRTIG